MKSTDSEIWQINNQNAACKVAAEHGNSTVQSVFMRYGARSFYELYSCYYSEVFADLEQIANDD